MVGRSYIVVSVGLNAFDSVVGIKSEFIEYLLIYGVFEWHKLLTWKESCRLFISELSVPRMLSDLLDAVTLIWVSLKDLGYEVRAVS